MLVTIVLVFLLCWGPKLIFNVMKYSDLEKYQTELHFRLQVNFNPLLLKDVRLILFKVREYINKIMCFSYCTFYFQIT